MAEGVRDRRWAVGAGAREQWEARAVRGVHRVLRAPPVRLATTSGEVGLVGADEPLISMPGVYVPARAGRARRVSQGGSVDQAAHQALTPAPSPTGALPTPVFHADPSAEALGK